jgi:hypothetical protein
LAHGKKTKPDLTGGLAAGNWPAMGNKNQSVNAPDKELRAKTQNFPEPGAASTKRVEHTQTRNRISDPAKIKQWTTQT